MTAPKTGRNVGELIKVQLVFICRSNSVRSRCDSTKCKLGGGGCQGACSILPWGPKELATDLHPTVLLNIKITNLKHQISISHDQNTHKSSSAGPSKPSSSVEDLIEHNRNDSFVWSFEFESRAAQALAPRVGICLGFGV